MNNHIDNFDQLDGTKSSQALIETLKQRILNTSHYDPMNAILSVTLRGIENAVSIYRVDFEKLLERNSELFGMVQWED